MVVTDQRTNLSKSDFVRVALEFVESHDISELTIRAIGKELGVDATALYRHFPKKESLLDAMLDAVLAEVVDLPDPVGASPKDCVIAILSNVRQVFRQHAHLSAVYVSATGDFPSGLILTRRISTHLVAMGLTGDNVVRTYQMLEGYTLGTSVFDSGGSPDTWTIRQARYRYVNMPQFDAVATDPDHVRKIADDGFIRAINIIIDDALSQPTQ
jgi:AcrR family transcriptional regulator